MKLGDFLDNALPDLLQEISSIEHKKAFHDNMIHLKIGDDKPFYEWMWIYLLWSELGTEEDIKSFYSGYDNEE